MTRMLAVCFIVLLTCIGIAQAQDQGAAPAASLADTVWRPSVGQLASWIDEGVTAAGADLDFFDLPVLDRMTWSSSDGVPLVGDRSLRFAALMTPELAAYTLGYGAAWQEDTWAAIEQDPEKVSNDLATALGASVSGGPMYFVVAASGSEYDDMLAAAYYDGQWRSLQVTPWGTVADYSPDTVGAAMSDPLWTAKYLMTQESGELPLQPADQVHVYLLTWARNASTQLDADFQQELPLPEWTDPRRARLTIGNAELLGWVDFDVILAHEQTHLIPAEPQPAYQPASAEPAAQGDTIVYVTNTGSKFHSPGCQHLDQSAFAVTRSEAVAQGYEPCSVCSP